MNRTTPPVEIVATHLLIATKAVAGVLGFGMLAVLVQLLARSVGHG